MVLPGNDLQRAVILDFEPKLANRCRKTFEKTLQRASILDFRPRLANRCKVFPFNPTCVHRFLISSPDLRIAAGENGFACYGRGGNDFPRPILIFVAAKKNGFACSPSSLRH